MLQSQVHMLLLVLLSGGLLVRVSGAPSGADLLAETLRADMALDKALARSLLMRLIYQLAARRADMLPELAGELGVRVMRRHLPVSQRERKAGCRNFFWKTFTSC
ncbi:somatostatin-1 [Dunckerocampus dactyliophorus]|uniref:somatostatin-1 n=1 Tax=Dunckerocampus dactyliophorus TaxID=161453 RepID=UPI002405356E|nr:somatostatin-1 [Dunckerocampus dactyliophorus]XP_054656117.1 somatostatin-1 [Dunckerocampus dactyliophorus]